MHLQTIFDFDFVKSLSLFTKNISIMIEEFNDLKINEFQQRLYNSVTENLTISCRKCGNLKVFKALFSYAIWLVNATFFRKPVKI